MEDTAASSRRPRLASPPGFPSVPQSPPRSSQRLVAAEPRGTGTGAPTPRTVRLWTREQRLLWMEREERERFERALQQQQQQQQQKQQQQEQSRSQQQESVKEESQQQQERAEELSRLQ
ncbi:unnamed protein product [Closterium sp. NIES-64]|nr:unnamed protein product [Closterium sp. NIES-64]